VKQPDRVFWRMWTCWSAVLARDVGGDVSPGGEAISAVIPWAARGVEMWKGLADVEPAMMMGSLMEVVKVETPFGVSACSFGAAKSRVLDHVYERARYLPQTLMQGSIPHPKRRRKALNSPP
jgi:hypothetical protein